MMCPFANQSQVPISLFCIKIISGLNFVSREKNHGTKEICSPQCSVVNFEIPPKNMFIFSNRNNMKLN